MRLSALILSPFLGEQLRESEASELTASFEKLYFIRKSEKEKSLRNSDKETSTFPMALLHYGQGSFFRSTRIYDLHESGKR